MKACRRMLLRLPAVAAAVGVGVDLVDAAERLHEMALVVETAFEGDVDDRPRRLLQKVPRVIKADPQRVLRGGFCPV